MLYAVYVIIKKPVIADFDRARATWWDPAVAGNSCLREGIRRRFVSEVACLNGKHCVDTFLDFENFFMTPCETQTARVPAQMESRRFENVPFGAHGTARAENWRPFGESGFHRAFPSSNGVALRLLGPERYCTGCYKTYTPVSLFKLASKSTTSTITARVLSFRRFTGRLRRRACWTEA